MENSIEVKAASQRELHQIAVDMILTSRRFLRKYPDFVSMLAVDHGSLSLSFKMYNPALSMKNE